MAAAPHGRTLASASRSRTQGGSRYYTALLWDLRPTTKVEATVKGGTGEGLTIEFSRSISGRRAHYAWTAATDSAGRLELTLFPGHSGFYQARALTAEGRVAGRWHSIPLNSGRRQVLELTLDDEVRTVQAGPAAKAAPPEGPSESELYPNTPNPFNAATRIAYRLAASGPVRLEIHNLVGQPVNTLVDQFQTAGAYQVSWNGRDRRGAAVAAGIYLARLSHPGGAQTRRLVLLK